MSEEAIREAREVNEKFYRAFESLDVGAMEEVWNQTPDIVCVHPGWRPLLGWGPVMQSWERIFEGVFEVKFEISETHLWVRDSIAAIVVEETITQRDDGGSSRATVMATNIFERIGGQWKMVLHHGSPVAMPPDAVPRVQ